MFIDKLIRVQVQNLRIFSTIISEGMIARVGKVRLTLHSLKELFQKEGAIGLKRVLSCEDGLTRKVVVTKNQKVLNNIIGFFNAQSPTNHVITTENWTKLNEAIPSTTSNDAARLKENFETAKPASIIKVGFQNLGQTCYMKSIVQALFMTPNFIADILRTKGKTRGNVVEELRKLFVELSNLKKRAIRPLQFCLASSPAHFKIGSQEDCAEYLRYGTG